MKKSTFRYFGILFLTGAFFAPGLQAAGGETLKLSSAEALQQVMQNSMQQMIEGSMEQIMQDALRYQPVQPGMLIRLSDDMPANLEEYINRGTSGNLPYENPLPQSRIPASGARLG